MNCIIDSSATENICTEGYGVIRPKNMGRNMTIAVGNGNTANIEAVFAISHAERLLTARRRS